jgi:hypothetical protein
MSGSQLVFVGCPAFVGRVRSETECDFYVSRSDFTESNAVAIDLRNNVQDASSWDDVEVDANITADPPGLTSLGPAFHGGSHKGVVYLEITAFQRLRNDGKLAAWPPSEDELYQYQNVVRRNGTGTLKRFHGFAAQVLEVNGTVARVAVYGVGASDPQRILWVDLGDPSVCDPPSAQLTTITPTVGSRGALFLSWEAINNESIRLPKLPPGEGAGTLPGSHDE